MTCRCIIKLDAKPLLPRETRLHWITSQQLSGRDMVGEGDQSRTALTVRRVCKTMCRRWPDDIYYDPGCRWITIPPALLILCFAPYNNNKAFLLLAPVTFCAAPFSVKSRTWWIILQADRVQWIESLDGNHFYFNAHFFYVPLSSVTYTLSSLLSQD